MTDPKANASPLGFKVDAVAIPEADIPDAARQQMVRVLAASMNNATPEEIVGYLADGWPEVVAEHLDRLGETEELSAHVDLLVLALRGESSRTVSDERPHPC